MFRKYTQFHQTLRVCDLSAMSAPLVVCGGAPLPRMLHLARVRLQNCGVPRRAHRRERHCPNCCGICCDFVLDCGVAVTELVLRRTLVVTCS
jgi:hypothetical protein